ncbi:EAL domain-containing protein [Enterobacteriaceae bacterium 89]|nr:EAL domain-containing protein [Enterobacteriaceae bacterium 89]
MNIMKSIRLQPIIDLREKRTFGYEVLSELSSTTNNEAWFHQQTPDLLLFLYHWQLQQLEGLAMKEKLFINLTLDTLLMPGIEVKLAVKDREIIVELQDPETLLTISGSQLDILRQRLAKLSMAGISVWLDDYRPEYNTALNHLNWHFDGIKIDRHIFKVLRHNQAEFNHLVIETRRYGKEILVEGIETAGDLFIAIQSPVDLAQGYFWSEVRIPVTG